MSRPLMCEPSWSCTAEGVGWGGGRAVSWCANTASSAAARPASLLAPFQWPQLHRPSIPSSTPPFCQASHCSDPGTCLIGHDHEVAVAQRLGIGVHLAVLQAQNLLDVLDLCIACDLGRARVAHVEQLAPGSAGCGGVWWGKENERAPAPAPQPQPPLCYIQLCPCPACPHLRGKTPKRSRPTTDSPATASDLAESPSVRISVQCSELRPPASLASSSLGMPAPTGMAGVGGGMGWQERVLVMQAATD